MIYYLYISNNFLTFVSYNKAYSKTYDRGRVNQRNTAEKGKCPKFEVIANLEVESVVNTFAVIIHLKLSHYGNDRLRKRV